MRQRRPLGFERVVEFLLDHGADLTATTEVADTALHSAVGIASRSVTPERCLQIVRLLVARGIDIHALNEWGSTALDYAKIWRPTDFALHNFLRGASLPPAIPLSLSVQTFVPPTATALPPPSSCDDFPGPSGPPLDGSEFPPTSRDCLSSSSRRGVSPTSRQCFLSTHMRASYVHPLLYWLLSIGFTNELGDLFALVVAAHDMCVLGRLHVLLVACITVVALSIHSFIH